MLYTMLLGVTIFNRRFVSDVVFDILKFNCILDSLMLLRRICYDAFFWGLIQSASLSVCMLRTQHKLQIILYIVLCVSGLLLGSSCIAIIACQLLLL